MMSLSVPNTGFHQTPTPPRASHLHQAQFAFPTATATMATTPSSDMTCTNSHALQHSSRQAQQQPDHSMKRSRGEGDTSMTLQHQHPNTPTRNDPFHPNEAAGKKSRSNKYFHPREIPKTLLHAMGTMIPNSQQLFVGHSNNNHSNCSGGTLIMGRQVPLRRQLSGGRIEAFLGKQHDDDAMDTTETPDNPNTTRARSMSF